MIRTYAYSVVFGDKAGPKTSRAYIMYKCICIGEPMFPKPMGEHTENGNFGKMSSRPSLGVRTLPAVEEED